MARVTKHPDVRREELMDATLRLCTTIGWDALSIDRLTATVGVAKGTFYYHFASKADLLAAIATRFGDELFATMDILVPTLTGPADQRFLQLIGSTTQWKIAKLDDALAFVPLLYKPENFELRHRLFAVWLDQTRPLFQPLIALGHDDGSFDVADPEATTEIVLSLWLDASTSMFDRALASDTEDEFVDILVRGQGALFTATERILGAKPGSLDVGDYADTYRAFRTPFLAALGHTPHTQQDPNKQHDLATQHGPIQQGEQR